MTEPRWQGGWGRNWDSVLRCYSSEDDSDEYDTPNIHSFQKMCRKNAELIQQFVPHMTDEAREAVPPLLMKDPYVMHGELLKSGFFDSVRSDESQVSDEGGKTTQPPPDEEGGPPSNEESVPSSSEGETQGGEGGEASSSKKGEDQGGEGKVEEESLEGGEEGGEEEGEEEEGVLV